jgi:thiamine-phosphate pyrophosphorylase
MCAANNAIFVVNNRVDMAMLLNAGVHVGQEDMRPGDILKARGQAEPPTLLGLSTHNAEQLAAAAEQPVDYVALGPIFSTASKANPDPVIGVERLSGWRSLASQPLVAIGGITRANARAVLDAGADSVAIIGGLYPEPCTESSLRERMEEWLQLTRM